MTHNSSRTYLALPILISLGIFILWLMFGAIIWAPSSPYPKSPDAIGDSYGMLTSLVTALSVVAIWFSLHYQRKDTNTQLEMLVQQLEEAKDSKIALELQAKETERASKIAALQSKLLFFSQQSNDGLTLTKDNIASNLYAHSLDVEVIRLICAIDELIKYRGKRIFYLQMEPYDLCKVWCDGIPYPKIEVTPIRVRNNDILFLIELPSEYECELYQINNIEPGELFDQMLSKFEIQLNEKASLMGEEYLYFNVSMEWGMHPHSRQYPQDYPISIQTASGFAHQYYVREKTIIDKPDS